ncbi:protein FAM219A [Lingula anatina]|uniref:Protein FAM219A n=1 Tax=Lingula anatina TaxID=7574 RepID=A0A1S3J0W9_LINAN|nr:protein FAM219A [Lingula anatina]|eukprot:XP_013403908.1 protein FAM219A [Lingula anatina]
MDSMEDSGIESDQRSAQIQQNATGNYAPSLKSSKRTTELQKKIEKQRDLMKKSQASAIDTQPRKNLLSRSRLKIPSRQDIPKATKEEQTQLLVAIPTDGSDEDEFDLHLSHTTNREIAEQLVKDGYNLDLVSDNEELDLIPPAKLYSDRCTCCSVQSNCSIQ